MNLWKSFLDHDHCLDQVQNQNQAQLNRVGNACLVIASHGRHDREEDYFDQVVDYNNLAVLLEVVVPADANDAELGSQLQKEKEI